MRFCIVGTGRCGSTLLQKMLNQHHQLFVFPETHWIPKMYEAFGTSAGDLETLINIVERTYHVTGEPVTSFDASRLRSAFEGSSSPTVREFCDGLGLLFARDAGKQSWADKTPDYGPCMVMLQRLWPDCRFVHVIRNGADVAQSMSRHPGYQWLVSAGEIWWYPASFNRYFSVAQAGGPALADFRTLWFRRFVRIRDEASRLAPGTYTELRFEDLISSPKKQLQELADFVNLEVTPDWISAGADLVQPDRVQSRSSRDDLLRFRVEERALLRELGYVS